MAKPDSDLDRLLRAAAKAEDPGLEIPFGFETRVVALARAQGSNRADDVWELARLLRRVAVSALVLTVFASSAAYWQFNENDEADEPYTNAYAIADNAIAAEFSQ
jgi:hypothetical protein